MTLGMTTAHAAIHYTKLNDAGCNQGDERTYANAYSKSAAHAHPGGVPLAQPLASAPWEAHDHSRAAAMRA